MAQFVNVNIKMSKRGCGHNLGPVIDVSGGFMFSYEDRIKAVKLYLKCESWAVTIRILGYPSVGALRRWNNAKCPKQ